MFSPGEILAPFWASHSVLPRGRDPLAIQNSSTGIYTTMMPGLTNVTNHIRYYGFYCWCLEAYGKLEKSDSKQKQRDFIRRAELLLAYIMISNATNVTAVGGGNYVNQHIEDHPFDLSLGANWEYKPNVHWQTEWGVFGQYYSAVMSEIDLIEYTGEWEGNIYVVSKKGEKLADAFDINTPVQEKELFWECVKKGKVTSKEAESLQSLFLHNIPVKSAEWNYYIDFLKSNDRWLENPHNSGNDSNRKLTLILLLDYIKKNKGTNFYTIRHLFLRNIYDTKAETALSKTQDAAKAWLLYEWNEETHWQLEHIYALFWMRLSPFPQTLNNVFEEIFMEIKEVLVELGLSSDADLATFYNSQKEIKSTYDWSDKMNESYHKKDPIKGLLYALGALYAFKQENEPYFPEISSFAHKYRLWREGNAISLVEHEVLKPYLSLSLTDILHKILHFIINRHLWSSYEKSRFTQSEYATFIIEEGTIRRMREVRPTLTSPRINILFGFLQELSCIDDAGEVSAIGNELYNQLLASE